MGRTIYVKIEKENHRMSMREGHHKFFVYKTPTQNETKIYRLYGFSYPQAFAVLSVPVALSKTTLNLFFLVIFYRLPPTWGQTTNWKTWSLVLTEHWHRFPESLWSFHKVELEVTQKHLDVVLGNPLSRGWIRWAPEALPTSAILWQCQKLLAVPSRNLS